MEIQNMQPTSKERLSLQPYKSVIVIRREGEGARRGMAAREGLGSLKTQFDRGERIYIFFFSFKKSCHVGVNGQKGRQLISLLVSLSWWVPFVILFLGGDTLLGTDSLDRLQPLQD
jgi:hypothetical protein